MSEVSLKDSHQLSSLTHSVSEKQANNEKKMQSLLCCWGGVGTDSSFPKAKYNPLFNCDAD